MKEERRKKLVRLLANTDSWMSSAQLAGALSVSERTIRNYLGELAESYEIESSRAGYRIVGGPRGSSTGIADDKDADLDQERQNHLISRLLSTADEVSVYDISDELSISSSTVMNSVIPRCRKFLERFDVRLENHDWMLGLSGSERAKRKLLGYVATHDAYGYFSSTETLSAMFPEFDTDALFPGIVNIFQKEDLTISDYALNNLLVHLIVIVVRLEGGNELDGAEDIINARELISELGQKERILKCTNLIIELVEQHFSCKIPERDYRQISLLVSLSCDRYDYNNLSDEQLASLMDTEFLDNVRSIAERMASRYGLPSFSREFMLQLTLHAYNTFQRAQYHVSCSNPIANQIKTGYAAVYDMAVYFTHALCSSYDITVSEDEIAFIAYHIGASILKRTGPATMACPASRSSSDTTTMPSRWLSSSWPRLQTSSWTSTPWTTRTTFSGQDRQTCLSPL